jgi:hypothetical protein
VRRAPRPFFCTRRHFLRLYAPHVMYSVHRTNFHGALAYIYIYIYTRAHTYTSVDHVFLLDSTPPRWRILILGNAIRNRAVSCASTGAGERPRGRSRARVYMRINVCVCVCVCVCREVALARPLLAPPRSYFLRPRALPYQMQ